MNEAAQALEKLIRDRGEDCASLSRLIGRNAAYVQQFIRRGVPRKLAEDDRRTLARYFGVNEMVLGGPLVSQEQTALTMVPRLNVGASAGYGALTGEEATRGHIGFDPAWLRRTASQPDQVSIIEVNGDSMAPTLSHGDEILVDRGDAGGRLRDGIYVLRVDDLLIVKRIVINPAPPRLSIRSDNTAYPAWESVDLAAVDVIGRVIWASRMIA